MDYDFHEAMKLANQLCFPLYAAARNVTGLYTPWLKPLGLTYTQYIVFLVLWEKDGVSVTEIGEKAFSGCPDTFVCLVYEGSAAHAYCLENSLSVELILFQLGDSSKSVPRLHALLRTLGIYDGEITGHFGEKTRQSILRFQAENGLPQDGVVTQSVMDAISAANSALYT